jgi:hypothetical protein
MSTNTKIALAAALIAALATPAFAQEYGDWTVNSGRYVNGQVPSYQMHKASNAEGKILLEGRNSGVAKDIRGVPSFSAEPSGRDALVQTPGN